MSAQSVLGATTGISAGEQAVAQRVQQVQALIEAAGQVASGETTAGLPGASSSSSQSAGGGGFASVLQAAAAEGTGVARSTDSASSGSGEYESLIDEAAARNGLDPAVLHGLIEQESGFDPSATSSAGASGLTQLMPGTAASLGVANPLNPAESIEGGARYLGQLTTEFGGNTEDALAAYNAGPGAVEQYGGIPPYAETQSYVSKVLGDAEAYRQSQPSTVLSESAA